MNLVCECCGFSQDFADGEEAFTEGWDAPPHFTGVITCGLCPSSYLVLNEKKRHIPIHEKWEREGRPEEFSQETCLIEEDHVSQEVLDNLLEQIKNLPKDLVEQIKNQANAPNN